MFLDVVTNMREVCGRILMNRLVDSRETDEESLDVKSIIDVFYFILDLIYRLHWDFVLHMRCTTTTKQNAIDGYGCKGDSGHKAHKNG